MVKAVVVLMVAMEMTMTPAASPRPLVSAVGVRGFGDEILPSVRFLVQHGLIPFVSIR
jgi:hypothetical protein